MAKVPEVADGDIVDSSSSIRNRLRRLREDAPTLITTHQCFEDTMTELNDLFQQPEDDRLVHLRGQILLATTTVLFAYDSQDTVGRDSFDAWLLTHVHRLWELARRTGVPAYGDSLILREAVVECLIDIEESLPGLLLCKLEELVSLVLVENYFTFQSYASLLSLVLRNASLVDRLNIKRTNEVLCLMCESPLKEDPNSNLSSVNVNKIIVQLMDVTEMLSTCSARYVVANLAQVVRALRLNPSVFKTFVHRNLSTFDLVVLDAILLVKDLFGEHLFGKKERDTFDMQTVSKSALPHYESLLARRCLLLELTKKYLRTADLAYDEEFFVPLPWDTPDVEERKIGLLVSLARRKEEQQGECAILMKCLDCLSSRLDHDVDGRQITILNKLIYMFSIRTDDSGINDSVIETAVRKVLLNVLSDHPQFTEHTLALLCRIKRDGNLSHFVDSIMSSAIEIIISAPLSELTAAHLVNYMLFLAEATARTETTPSETSLILKFISKMMDYADFEAESDSSIWFLGYRTLDVCKHLLCHHNTNINFSEIGEVLHKISTRHDDLDVRDRAEFYYMLLTTLSPRKITALLKFRPQGQPGNYNFTQSIGGESTYTYPLPVLATSEMIFNLQRVVMDFGDREDSEEPSQMNDGITDYLSWLKDDDVFWSADFKYELSIAPHAGSEYDVFYAIVLSFSSTNSSSEVQNVEVLKLSRDKGGVEVAVKVMPSRVVCTCLHVSAVFNTLEGVTCSTSLAPIALRFQDLLQPLPVPANHGKHSNAWRRSLAEILWSEFTAQHSKKNFLSVMRVIAKRETYETLVSVTLRPFVTDMFLPDDVDMKCTIGIFLPRCSHLIMRMKYGELESGFYVRFVTDDEAVLPQVNIFLHNLEESGREISPNS